MEEIVERINKSAVKFLEPLNPLETYKTIVEEAIKLVDASYGSIFLEKNGELERVYASNEQLYNNQIRKKGYTYKAYKTLTPSLIYIDKFAQIHPEAVDLNIKSTIFIPLFHNNNPIGVLSVDATADKSMDKKELQTMKLFGSLATMAILKTQMYYETKKALKLRDIFMEMAAHELRTPLTSMNGYIQLLNRKMVAVETREAHWVRQLYSETSRLTNLINELLEVNRIRTGKSQYVFTELSLIEVINKSVDAFKLVFADRNVVVKNLIKNNEDIIIGDTDKLVQVFENLVENAAKFSDETNAITITLKSNKTIVSVAIEDKGRGMDENNIHKAFEGDFQDKNTSKEGIGVGLFLAKNIIDNHHGIITIHSHIGKGTKVKVTLPKIKV